MAERKEPPDWKCISCSFDSNGKRRVLPVSLLMQLTSLVKEKKDLFSSQVLKEDFILAPTPFSAVESENHTNDGTEKSEKAAKKLDSIGKRGKQGQTENCAQPKKKKKLTEWKPKKNVKQDSPQELPDDDNDGEEKTKRKRPNFFVAVQITNPEIQSAAKNIQSGIQEAAKVNLHHAIIGVEKFHITLMVMHLPGKEEVQKAVESLDRCVPCMLERTSGQSIELHFQGLSTFSGGRVLFSSPTASQGLDYLHFLSDEVSVQMNNNGIVTTDKRDRHFHPHLTLLKFDGHKGLRRKGMKRVEANQYGPYVNEVLGTQTVSSMQLCHMDKKRADGYYLVEHEVFFTK